MIGFKVKVVFNASKVIGKHEATAKRARLALSKQILKDSNYYIPAREWYLRTSGRMSEYTVSWHTAYARRLYYNPQYNFSTDKNPNAGGLWFQRAKETKLDVWVKKTKDVYRLAFGGGK